MEEQSKPPTAAKTEAQSMPRQPYAPPKATFVPLKLEERLLACDKMDTSGGCLQQLLFS